MNWADHKGAKLGRLCKRHHDHSGGKSYRLPNYSCVECALFQAAHYRHNNRQRYRNHARNWRRNHRIEYLVHNIRSTRNGKITVDDLKPFPDVCPLLGTKLQYVGLAKDKACRPSVDRIDSKRGYVPGNVWIISVRANTIKNDATPEELIMIGNNLKKKWDL